MLDEKLLIVGALKERNLVPPLNLTLPVLWNPSLVSYPVYRVLEA